MDKKSTISRRQFLSYSALIGVAGALGSSSLLSSCTGGNKGPKALKAPGEYYVPTLTDQAIDGKPLKAGVVGCGGRGSGAAENFLKAAPNVTITAIGDVLPDRLASLRKTLAEKYNINLPDEMCFVGFDAYQKVMDSGVDAVILAAPPVFRPLHFKYATDKGIHSFLEKPMCVDSDGYRSIVATSKQALSKGLCVITGTQRHHHRAYVASYAKIQEGLIGQITGGCVYWNQNMLWYRNRQPGWSDMEWMIRDWVNWKWLSGDHIVEQHVHNIDVFTWFSGLKPVRASGFGSRHRRITGDQYDNFSVDFEFEGGIHMHSMCRQIDGTSFNVSEFIQGTNGSWSSRNDEFVIKDLAGNEIWRYDKETAESAFTRNDAYDLEHVNWITHIRNNQPISQAEETAVANIAAIMGRESAYTGKDKTFDEISAASQNYMLPNVEMGPVDMSGFTVPVPGTGK